MTDQSPPLSVFADELIIMRSKFIRDMNANLFADGGGYRPVAPLTDDERRQARRAQIKELIGVRLPIDDWD